MQTFKCSVKYGKKASRSLVIARIILSPLIFAFLFLIFAVNVFALPISFLRMLVTGRRTTVLFRLPQMLVHDVGNWLAFLLNLSDSWPPKTCEAEILYIPRVSHFELFFRPILSFMILFNLALLCFPFFLVWLAHTIYILVFGSRRKGLFEFLHSFWQYGMSFLAYAFLGTDERPILIPSVVRKGDLSLLLA